MYFFQSSPCLPLRQSIMARACKTPLDQLKDCVIYPSDAFRPCPREAILSLAKDKGRMKFCMRLSVRVCLRARVRTYVCAHVYPSQVFFCTQFVPGTFVKTPSQLFFCTQSFTDILLCSLLSWDYHINPMATLTWHPFIPFTVMTDNPSEA